MVEQKGSLLNQLERDLPEGLVVDAAWLDARGISRSLRSYYLQAGWLTQPVRGLYWRSRGPLKWQNVVVSMQTLLGMEFIVGGQTALDLQGYAHYLRTNQQTVYLYGPNRPPGWLAKLPLSQRFLYRNSGVLFANDPIHLGLTSRALNTKTAEARDMTSFRGGDVTTLDWGPWDMPLTLSSPERAFLELLDELPGEESFDQADMLMQGAANLSPRKLQKLLQDCRSVKVKRLFLFFADRHKHAWRKRLDLSTIDLGSGKRMLVKGGRLDPTYHITVPEEFYGAE